MGEIQLSINSQRIRLKKLFEIIDFFHLQYISCFLCSR